MSWQRTPSFAKGLHQALTRLGKEWGRTLGDPDRPAVFSVRSGARVSMPGMMITITNVGMNDEIAEASCPKRGSLVCVRFLSPLPSGVYTGSVRRGQR